jgi:hypothetical protein
MKKINTSTYLLLFWFHIFFISCNQDSIDKVNSPIAYESIGGFKIQMILHNLITKFSFENSISDSKTGGVGTDVSYAPGIKGKHIKDLLLLSLTTTANPLIAIKALLFLCGLKQTHIRRSTIFIYVTKTTDFWGNIFTLVEGTGPLLC